MIFHMPFLFQQLFHYVVFRIDKVVFLIYAYRAIAFIFLYN